MRNHTQVTEFILLGLTDDPDLQVVIFLYMSASYILSVTGNLTIVILTLLDSCLHTPMYFFLRCFSFLEICVTSACIPRFLAAFVTGDRTISYNCCVTQLFFVILLVVTEFFVLAAMSYDRYVAICRPLHYTTVMSQRVCTLLVLCSWLTGFLFIFPPLILGLQLDFCGPKAIDHFFCDISPLLLLSCSDTGFLELMAFILSMGTQLVTLVLVAITRAILRLPSAQQRKKAFSTCSSHMVVVSITYGSCIFMYIKPSAKDRVDLNKGVAVLYTSVVPVMNPFIYTLRNQQVKQAIRDLVHRVKSSSKGKCYQVERLIPANLRRLGKGMRSASFGMSYRSHRSARRNHTQVTEFTLLGLMDDPDLQTVILLYMPVTYVLSAPDWIFLQEALLLLEGKPPGVIKITQEEFVIPLLSANITGDRTISFNTCVTQLFFFILLEETDFFLLAASESSDLSPALTPECDSEARNLP
ncbi:olfactory receptor 6C74-like [Tachyglossus aculeatus]|uniref:olfactory receptor 6C74-like n=1 Tax=Tachyglossus aculeatus TaxID=9261 RepID=UPI0018F74A7E|nr:olfactory receptor 6C74-like [Tachyglossus aculeatus]